MDEFEALDGIAQAALVRSGDVRADELAEAAIARIEERDPQVNAVVAKLYDTVVDWRPPEQSTPLTGVPFLVKDLLADVAGAPMTSGSRLLAGYVSAGDSELVSRYRRGGLMTLGKTNVPEFGILGTTESQALGPCRNPWDLTRSVGGSSGGAAAAVAARMTPLAHGSDGGGSIRIPASCCGVFGLKPTRGRNPLGPSYGELYAGLAVEHALTVSVRDSAALLDISSGPGLGDPYSAHPPARSFLSEVGTDPGRLRIAMAAEASNGVSVDPDCRAAVEDAARLCESLGHDVETAHPIVDEDLLADCFDTIWTSSIAATIDDWLVVVDHPLAPGDVEPLTEELYERGRVVTATHYVRAVTTMHRLARQVAEFFTRYDVLLTPTLTQPPPQLGWFDSPASDVLRPYRRDAAFCAFMPLANLTGQPAMSVPSYWSSDGLPIGTQYVGRFGDEAGLIRLASQLESARPWAHRRPPIIGGAGPARAGTDVRETVDPSSERP